MSLYVPLRLVRFYRRRVSRKPEKYSELLHFVEKSRLKMTVPELLSIALFYPLLATIPGVMLGYVISRIIQPAAQVTIRNVVIDYEFIELGICLGFAVLAFGFTRYMILSYPIYLSKIRSGKIDSALPHTVNMMLGMAKGGVSLLAMFRFIAENRQIFGDVSEEFERIVVLAEGFGYDLISAIRYVADTTPSEKLKTFLENFVNVYEGGGNIVDYLMAKSDQFLTERETYYTLFFETLQVFAEIYLALFIVAPLFFLTVLVVFQMVGGGALQAFKLLIYLFVPLGSMLIIWLVKSSIPKEPSGLGEYVEEVEKIDLRVADRKPGFQINNFRRRLMKLWRFFTRPLTEEVYTLTVRAVSFYLLLPAVVFFTLAYGKIELDFLIFTTLSSIVLPAIFFIEYRERKISKMEKELPEFLKQLASLNEAGLNVVEALRHLSETELGVLGREIRRVKREIEWGGLVTSALEKIERRVRSNVFAKAISLLIRAIESAPTIRDALVTASLYSELEIEIRDRVKSQMSMYIIIIYLSFGVFLYTTYVLIQNMLSIFTSINAPVMGISPLDLSQIRETFFETSLIVSVFSGIMAGVMGEGKLEAGLKHVFILVVIVYVFFRFVLP